MKFSLSMIRMLDETERAAWFAACVALWKFGRSA